MRTTHVLLAVVLSAAALAGCEPEIEAPEAVPATPPADTPPAPPTSTPTPTPDPEPGGPRQSVPAYGVSAGHPDAVEAGMRVLAHGGNAVDAAVAAAYAVSVVEPFASGLGGGGAAIVAPFDEDPIAYDYREVVPADGRIPASNTGVPGFVAGMEILREDHGSMDLEALLEPALALAHSATASETLAAMLRSGSDRLAVGELDHLYPDGRALAVGAPLVQDELARTLETIAREGPRAFYEGAIAETVAGAVEGIDAASLAAYEVQRGSPPAGWVGDHEIVAAKPPLPGASLVQALQVAEAAGAGDHDPDSAEFIHLFAMSWRAAEQFMLTDLGDPAFVETPVGELTDPERNAALAERISMDSLLPVDADAPRGGLQATPRT